MQRAEDDIKEVINKDSSNSEEKKIRREDTIQGNAKNGNSDKY